MTPKRLTTAPNVSAEKGRVGGGNFELCVPQPKMVCRSLSGVHHLRAQDLPRDLVLEAHKRSNR